ncbi:hypothetical protein EV196_103302 [Mariniflexile fucanivorans]|uniref:Uncharacterized protein n=1 Tax=Mariniflexile fucanivorans TaxID=264023 RepID=A0A4R1RKZ7_9FLAO|nr:hypothetical protein EV196_103302 [Mariniflexile fucanivorans]
MYPLISLAIKYAESFNLGLKQFEINLIILSDIQVNPKITIGMK